MKRPIRQIFSGLSLGGPSDESCRGIYLTRDIQIT
jgi:hypothetical protein